MGLSIRLPGTAIYPGGDLCFTERTPLSTSLSLAAGARPPNFDLGTSHNGANDLLVVDGNLALNGNTLHLKAPGTSVNLDTSDYTLFTFGTISGSFAPDPQWDVPPANFANYTVQTVGHAVVLHYSLNVAPSGVGSANPSSVSRNGSATLTVTTTNGSHPITSVVISNTAAIGGSSARGAGACGPTNATALGAVNVYTNTVTIGAGVASGRRGALPPPSRTS